MTPNQPPIEGPRDITHLTNLSQINMRKKQNKYKKKANTKIKTSLILKLMNKLKSKSFPRDQFALLDQHQHLKIAFEAKIAATKEEDQGKVRCTMMEKAMLGVRLLHIWGRSAKSIISNNLMWY